MDLLSSYQLTITVCAACIFTPFFSIFIFQLPRKILADYHNECIDFLELKKKKLSTVSLFAPTINTKGENSKLTLALYYVPILSYVIAKTKLKKQAAIAPEQRLFIETITIITCITTMLEFGMTPQGLSQLAFYLSLIAIAFIDARTKLIPDILSLTMLWAGLIASIQGWSETQVQLAVWGAIAGYSGPWLISKAVCLQTKRPDGMGYGDFKMLAMLGAWLGPLNMLNTVILASFGFMFYFMAMRMANKVSRHSLIPFGPFLSIAAWAISQNDIFVFSEHLKISGLLI
ncbi:MAG: prepilin peptidase [Legionellales bacterium]|nr:prepilin peptidase [Legionellales bacterium]